MFLAFYFVEYRSHSQDDRKWSNNFEDVRGAQSKRGLRHFSGISNNLAGRCFTRKSIDLDLAADRDRKISRKVSSLR